ncbi:MFS general substrate transporter [Infundibulicybe gibba]|nr:MFS general substrate transporter [Infundibulicybe gibba]
METQKTEEHSNRTSLTLTPDTSRLEIGTKCVDDFPEGGWEAWATVLGAWIIQFCTFGYTNAFGVYQDFYVREYLNNFSSSQISWIGSLQVMLLFSVGIFSGRAFDRGYFYYLVTIGSALVVISLFMLSLAQPHQYYQIFLSQGLASGIGFGMLYAPAMSAITRHFKRRRALAMGIVTTGSSLGGVLHPIMLNNLFHGSVGFHQGVRASAGLNLALLAIACLLMRTRPIPGEPVDMVPKLKTFLRDPPYLSAIAGTFLSMAGILVPFFFLQLDATNHNIATDLSFSMLAIMNGASVIGRLVTSIMAEPLGVYNLMIPCTMGCSILAFALSAAHNVQGMIAISVLYGLFSGAFVSLLGPALAMLAQDVSEIGARMGVCFFFLGFASLLGTPLAGLLLTKTFIWWRPFVMAGVCLMAGAGFLGVTQRLITRGKRTR